jgi:5'-3' exonuclease
MGIRYLNNFLKKSCPKSIQTIPFKMLDGKKIAIDISIYMYKYISENKLIENIYLMLSIFKQYNITPVFIFDGKPPPEKLDVLQQRREFKMSAQSEYNSLKSRLDILTSNNSNRHFSTLSDNNNDKDNEESKKIMELMDALKPQFIYITKDIVNNVKELLRAYGATYFDSPGEADELCAMLVFKNKVWACMSDDMDMFAYGCSNVLRMTDFNNHTTVLYCMTGILSELRMNQTDFRQLCVLCGTDYYDLYKNDKHDKNDKNTFDLYKSLTMLTLYKKEKYDKTTKTLKYVDFYEWIIQNRENIDHDLLKKIYNMFDLSSNTHENISKLFENVKIVNGKIMSTQLNDILLNNNIKP